MQHFVAIGTNGTQIIYRVQNTLLLCLREWYQVVNVDEPRANLPISLLEVKATH